jgi:hypothetical protein
MRSRAPVILSWMPSAPADMGPREISAAQSVPCHVRRLDGNGDATAAQAVDESARESDSLVVPLHFVTLCGAVPNF